MCSCERVTGNWSFIIDSLISVRNNEEDRLENRANIQSIFGSSGHSVTGSL